jgi:hypothetical protein
MKEFIKALGRDVPSDQMEDIEAIGNKRKIAKYCRRFPLSTKKATPVAKATPKPTPVKTDEEE